MSEAIIVALISSVVTVLGVILSNSKTLAVINNEIKHLTEAVNKHNNFATRIPVLEEKINVLEQSVKDLEKENKEKN